MHAKNFLINQSGNWQAVETVGESLPQLDVVTALALIIEAIDSVDRGAFVVTSKKKEILRVLNFVSEKKTDSLK